MVAADVLDLTIIDLPGIVRTHVAGQDASVMQDVRDLLDRYLKQDRTVILAVRGMCGVWLAVWESHTVSPSLRP